MITRLKVNPKWITIELTELAAMHSPQYMIKLFSKLKKLGVNIAIDDYGTGSSSLLCIKRFGVDYLKIDQNFVEYICTDEIYEQVVSATITMAKHLGIDCIAEGVATTEQHALLKKMGCDYVQGFALGRPLSANQFEFKYLAE